MFWKLVNPLLLQLPGHRAPFSVRVTASSPLLIFARLVWHTELVSYRLRSRGSACHLKLSFKF